MEVRHVELKKGQSVRIGLATLTLEEKSGQRARLRVEAPKDVVVDHGKRYESQARHGVLAEATE